MIKRPKVKQTEGCCERTDFEIRGDKPLPGHFGKVEAPAQATITLGLPQGVQV